MMGFLDVLVTTAMVVASIGLIVVAIGVVALAVCIFFWTYSAMCE
jgi:hypothetical protein